MKQKISQTSTSSSFTSAHFGLSPLEIRISALVLFRISLMIEPLFPIIQPITLDGTRSRIETVLSSSSFIFPCISRTASTAIDFRSLGDYKIHIHMIIFHFKIKQDYLINIEQEKDLHAEYRDCGNNTIHQLVIKHKTDHQIDIFQL